VIHRAMILCAGLGERLRPLTEELPKPLVPVGDRPALAHITQALAREGYDAALANTHWLQEKFSVNSNDWGLSLNLSHEPEIRGVAGGVAGARSELEAPVVVWNGDTLIAEPPLGELARVAATTGGICLAVAQARGAGTVGLDAEGRLVRVRGERHGVEVRVADYVCLFSLGQQALAELPERGDLFSDYCLPRLRRGEPVYTCPAGEQWWDVGSLDGYLRANHDWLARHATRADASFVAPTARVSPGVVLRGSVVGAGARVEGAGVLEECVIWPNATATAPLSRCVVTPLRSVQAGARPKP
jgi:mannose-1-phosphate guanylyltransferase